MRSWAAVVGAAIAALALGGGTGCATSAVRESCIRLQASPDLNTYDGQPHVVVLTIYPLQSSLGFNQASSSDLVRGTKPEGLAGNSLQYTVQPGESRMFREEFPGTTRDVGLVADYYRAPGDPEGSRKVVVPAKCGWWSKPRVVLAPRDLLRE
jgi:type VI secretion system VasD/TssJ family lipoprotein